MNVDTKYDEAYQNFFGALGYDLEPHKKKSDVYIMRKKPDGVQVQVIKTDIDNCLLAIRKEAEKLYQNKITEQIDD